MSAVYAKLRTKLALVFAREPFVDATISRTTPGTYDPLTRKTGTASTTTIACRAFLDTVTVTGADGQRSSYTAVTLNVAPLINDKITIGGIAYRVTAIDAEKPDGAALIFEATVAR